MNIHRLSKLYHKDTISLHMMNSVKPMSVCLILLVVSKKRYSDMGILHAIALQDQLPPP